ncbi:MAG: putative bifunctional diguanylate cyclase/phosphodiesterase [Thermoanaerobaculia bacterium]
MRNGSELKTGKFPASGQSGGRPAAGRFEILFDENLAAVFRTDSRGRLTECNEAFARTFGYTSAREAIASPSAGRFLVEADRERVVEAVRGSGTATNLRSRAIRRDGATLLVLGNYSVTGEGEEQILEGALIELHEHVAAERALDHQLYHDSLTGLPTRKLFRDRLDLALEQARRKNRGLAVLFCDLDHFKLVNDHHGHEIGDLLLQAVAARLADSIRKIDTVARLGGDEFIILLLETSTGEDAIKVGRKVLDSIGAPFVLGSREIAVSASVGISLFPEDGSDQESLLRNADAAMNRAKEAGRNNCQIYTPSIHAQAIQKLLLEAELKEALRSDEFEVYYQPQIRVKTGEITGFEALVRWNRPGGQVVLPGSFMAVAEESDVIIALGARVLERACREARSWHDAGFTDVSVAVNLSPRQIQAGGVIDSVTRALTDSRLPARSLELEVTESVAMQDLSQSRALFSALRGLGIRIAIDDFGTGHSSLSYVKHLPVQTLKIDQSFVRDLPESSVDEAIVGAIVHMARALRLRVLAEGVETLAQRDLLLKRGCGEMQGFLFSRALPGPAVLDLLRDLSPRSAPSGEGRAEE